MCKNHKLNLDLVSNNAYTKIGNFLLISSQDIEGNRNCDGQNNEQNLVRLILKLWSCQDGQFLLPHFFLWASLTMQLTSTSGTFFSLLTDNPSSISRKKENGSKYYFISNLLKRMGLGQDPTHDPCICSTTCICSQTHFLLRYAE